MHKKTNFLRPFLRKNGPEKLVGMKKQRTKNPCRPGPIGAPSVSNTNGTIVPCRLDDWRPKDGWPKGLPPRMVGF